MNLRCHFLNNRKRVQIAWILLIVFALEMFFPSILFALTSGPSQPEMDSFTPAGTNDMVDHFTGDFSYNIPLLKVGDYPVNLSYHSGITMDQEASWVGLGWNINAGVINRNVRGIPDDFNGDQITKKYNLKENKTYGVTAGVGAELFGIGKKKLSLQRSATLKYNNYQGVGMDRSINMALSAASPGKVAGTQSLGINSSSDDGLTIQPSIGLSLASSKSDSKESSVGLSSSVGVGINSRQGLKAVTIGVSASAKVNNNKSGNQEVKGSNGLSKSGSFEFGTLTYTPQAGLPMHNTSVTASFKAGGEIYGLNGTATLGGFYSSQRLSVSTISNPSYGYMNEEAAMIHENALLDFNREKDIPFNKNVKNIPVTNFTYDIFSVNGQGVSGSYRPFRSDLGYVYDPVSTVTSDGVSIGAEAGLGELFHGGADVTVNEVSSRSGKWSSENDAISYLSYKGKKSNSLYEPYYFKEANEKTVDSDESFFVKVGQGSPVKINLQKTADYSIKATKNLSNGTPLSTVNHRNSRQKRNQLIQILNRSEQSLSGLEPANSLGYSAPFHHISEISTLKEDGTRYVFGLPAYNTKQNEVSFAVGTTLEGAGGRLSSANNSTGLIAYNPSDNSESNICGLDNYYSDVETPAFAHSYLLTAVLSPDYIDNDGVRGPSDNDFGDFTKFSYKKINNYKWRIPMGTNLANYNEGLKSVKYDDKANYLYGEKELWYLEKIVSKNYVAIFSLGDREDGLGVLNKNGQINSVVRLKYLKSITLYSKPDYLANGSNAIPIKKVHFEYNYSLCPFVPNNTGNDIMVNGSDINANAGKLTLKRVSFSYQNSKKGRLSPYEFTYSTVNPRYNLKGADRWGNYKPNVYTTAGDLDSLTTSEYPYVEQNQTLANSYSQAWSLTDITLPSGGKIHVDYESDDYGYVQNRQAMQMFKVVDFVATSTSLTTFSSSTTPSVSSLNHSAGTSIVVKLQEPITGVAKDLLFRQRYLKGIGHLYFRVLVKIKGGTPDKFDFVSGYIKESDILMNSCFVDPSGNYASIALANVKTNDNTGSDICPITKAGIQFGRLNLNHIIWDNTGVTVGENASLSQQLIKSMIASSFFKNIKDMIKGPNEALFSDYRVAESAVRNKSWVRLNSPLFKKLGGGSRVKRIKISDEWAVMTNNLDKSSVYGQEYSYTYDDNTSSGVASYEPQAGGDENPFRQPVYSETKNILAPDDEQYVEEPFGEMFFPNPSVGYAHVTVKNLQYTGVKKHATGKLVYDYYTSRDFPTITERTNLEIIPAKTNPYSIKSLLKIDVKDYMTVSQGYLIELNDMHGKLKAEESYGENQVAANTSKSYYYKCEPYLYGALRLKSEALTIDPEGKVETKSLGAFYDFVADLRESQTTVTSTATNGNLDVFTILGAPIPIPIIIPSHTKEKTQFRSAGITKVIQRFGILDKVVSKDLGSVSTVSNLAYDSETGEVIVTESVTGFNDPIYSFEIPGHWYYGGMGPAYRNIGLTTPSIVLNGGIASFPNAKWFFHEGDELALTGPSNELGWVSEVNTNSIKVIAKNGDPISGNRSLKIIRSGRRNQLGIKIAKIISLENPVINLSSNNYLKVLNATADEYGYGYKTHCDCFNTLETSTTNPYVLGTKGSWRKQRSYQYLTDRSQSDYNRNTNIRIDGVYKSFSPFYQLKDQKWIKEDRGWTFANEVTEYSPMGVELENKDALNRYSSATYGFNQSLATAVSSNARYKEIGFDSFEDYGFNDCIDNHFKFKKDSITISSTESHSGNKSIKVTAGTSVSLRRQIDSCEVKPCQLYLADTLVSNTIQVRVFAGTKPYQIEYNKLSGNPTVHFPTNGDQINFFSASSFSIEVIVTDSKNCRVINRFTK